MPTCVSPAVEPPLDIAARELPFALLALATQSFANTRPVLPFGFQNSETIETICKSPLRPVSGSDVTLTPCFGLLCFAGWKPAVLTLLVSPGLFPSLLLTLALSFRLACSLMPIAGCIILHYFVNDLLVDFCCV